MEQICIQMQILYHFCIFGMDRLRCRLINQNGLFDTERRIHSYIKQTHLDIRNFGELIHQNK